MGTEREDHRPVARFATIPVRGKGRGRDLGFPTLNLHIPADLTIEPGIYAARVQIEGRTYEAALHYGPVPAFGEDEPSLEVHLLDTALEATPNRVEVEVVRYLRPVRWFETPQALSAQIAEDVQRSREVLGGMYDHDTATRRVAEEMARRGVRIEVLRFLGGTRTVQEAADAIGTSPERITKTLVFLADGRPVLVLASGANRVSRAKLAAVAGAGQVRTADAQTVERTTGFPVGAIPPVGHTTPLPTYIDQDLLRHEVVYAGAGAPDAMFAVAPEDLVRATGARVVDLREDG
ncbi:MAG: YbaK/EbsC family protein [Armatimonadota bacterium]|nr:YbaK/EbsC family protein [Armatimonadota bacterium]MDR5696477.1 YbaK/EbsC family protein [Armatimonadota bacterium]